MSTTSLIDLKNDVQRWYAEKSQEFCSTNYLKTLHETFRLTKSQKKYEHLEQRLFLERQRIQHEFLQKFQSVPSTDVKKRRENLLKKLFPSPTTSPLSRLSINKTHFEPESEISLEEVFAPEIVDKQHDQNELDVLKPSNETYFDANSTFTTKNEWRQQTSLFQDSPSLQSFKETEYFSTPSTSTPPTSSLPEFSFKKTSTPFRLDGEKLPEFSIRVSAIGINDDQKPKDVLKVDSNSIKWINIYQKFHTDLINQIKVFEKNAEQKKSRLQLKRTIVDRINFSAKKQASNQELAQVLAFFNDLFELKMVKDGENNEFCLDGSNKQLIQYAIDTICLRYIEQVKWDSDLLNTVTMVIASLCNKSELFYQIFCANIVHSSTFLKIDISKILDKILLLGQAPPEASTHWLSTETTVFQLFLNVQFALTSHPQKSNLELNLEKMRGSELIRMLLLDVLFMEKHVLLASGFLVGEILKNSWKQLCKSLNKAEIGDLKTKIVNKAEEILNFEWEQTLATICDGIKNEKLSSVLRSRHDAILVQLRHSLAKFY